MKKIFLFLCIAMMSFTLCSCNDTKIIEIDNMIWKDNVFNIVATSSQLQKQSYNQHLPNDDDYYSSIMLNDVNYSCEIHMENGNFNLNLYNPLDSSKIYFFGESEVFLWGHFSNDEFYKVKNKDYKYTLTIALNKIGQYYEYCNENDVIFPNALILYGYENQ